MVLIITHDLLFNRHAGLCKFVRLKHVFITTTSVFAGLFVLIVLFKQCSYSPKKAN